MNYIQQAYKGKIEFWMFLLTSVLISGIFIINFIAFLFTPKEDIDAMYALIKNIPSNVNLVINLAPFAILLILLFILVKYLHQRSILSLTTSRSKIDWKRFFFSFFLVVLFLLISFGFFYYLNPSQVEIQFNAQSFAILLIISLILFPLQIGLEEYLFRGYFMQHIGIMVKNRWFPLILTSVLFGIAHSANPEVSEMGLSIMIFYIGTGLILGIMTLMDEGLELALGFHLGNNLIAALLITYDWSVLQTDAIFRYTGDKAESTFSEILLPLLFFYPIFLFILAKKYKWTNWNEKLFGKVEKPIVVDEEVQNKNIEKIL